MPRGGPSSIDELSRLAQREPSPAIHDSESAHFLFRYAENAEFHSVLAGEKPRIQRTGVRYGYL